MNSSQVRKYVFSILIHGSQVRVRAKGNGKNEFYTRTSKASNFGPHGNFGPLFEKGLAIIETRPTEK
jgi:hypothetical protein